VTGGPQVAIVDYGIGNLRSAEKALQRVGADAVLTSDAAVIAAAEAVVLPGVGAFGACMAALREIGLESVVAASAGSGRPFLGICVGTQLLFDSSEESPGVPGLGIIPGTVRWLSSSVKRPQMQWNRLEPCSADEPLFSEFGAEAWMYFVHSLHGVPNDPSDVIATVDYGGRVNAAFRRGPVVATQFHPEKSAQDGLSLLGAFVASIRSGRDGASGPAGVASGGWP
jgi:imidazole glycerol-phosphate synthase subunit HisH